MKLSTQELPNHLKQALKPVYLISGDEPLLVQENADLIRQACQAAGFTECIRLTVDHGFDWSSFKEATMSGSLFSNQQTIVLRLLSMKLGDAGKQALQAYLEKPSVEKRLVIIADKLDAAAQKTAWFKALTKVGIYVPIWPLQGQQLLVWIERRLRQVGLGADQQSMQLLAELTEGNLLATNQAIEKLALLYPQGKISFEQVKEACADNARFSVFDLVDKILEGRSLAILRVLDTLKQEGVEPILIAWAVTKELRDLMKLIELGKAGQSLTQALNTQKVWEKRKPMVTRTLKCHSEKSLLKALAMAGQLDLMIKGLEKGNVWDALADISLTTAGVRLPHIAYV